MSLPDVMAIVLGLSLTAYAVFAGPDFGAGILDLLSGSGAANPRASPERSGRFGRQTTSG